MRGNEDRVPLLRLCQELLHVELPDRRLLSVVEDSALTNDPLDLLVRPTRIEQAKNMNAVLRHCFEAGKDSDAGHSGRCGETFGSGYAEVIGHGNSLDLVLDASRDDG